MAPIALRGPCELKDPAVTPEFEYLTSSYGKVRLHHPAYDRRHDLLLILGAWDAETCGICYGLAHDACAIIAGNRHEGWLANSPGGEPLIYTTNAILPAGDYWYHLPVPATEDDDGNSTPTSVYRWPVVASFQDWEFPENLPSAWITIAQGHSLTPVGPSSLYSSLVRSRDISCRITNHSTGTEVAHLCPQQEMEWFGKNTMHQYNSNVFLRGKSRMNDANNLILLRSDLHKAFDDGLFFLYPKNDELVVHVMQPGADIRLLYHNTRTHSITSCSPQFIYTRFAWSIFHGLHGFLQNGIPRSVIKIMEIGGALVKKVEEMDGFTQQAKSNSRGRSPTKRKRNEDHTRQADEAYDPAAKRPCLNSINRTRYINSSPSSTFPTEDDATSLATPPPFKDNTNLKKEDQARKSSSTQESEHLEQLREQYLHKQRPAGFRPITFENARNVREQLESVGVEFRSDSLEEA